MNSDYFYKVRVSKIDKYTVRNLNEFRRVNPHITIMAEVSDTTLIDREALNLLHDSILIRIEGPYDRRRLELYKDVTFADKTINGNYINVETSKEALYDSVIYNRREVATILDCIGQIESGIMHNWSDFQKLVYIYDSLKQGIMYDPKYRSRPSKDVRSLRGLFTKKTVCAGYAVILQELLKRQGIKCHFISGHGHAWNIVEMGGKLYPVDLTWDNEAYRFGDNKSNRFLGQNVELFAKEHIPESMEPFKNYEHRLCTFDPDSIRRAQSKFSSRKVHSSDIYFLNISDGSRTMIVQLGLVEGNGERLYKYYFAEVDKNLHVKNPTIVYSKTNVDYAMSKKEFSIIPLDTKRAIFTFLLSKENIRDSLEKRNTSYIGSARRIDGKFVSNLKEIPKDNYLCRLFRKNTKVLIRRGGTQVVLERLGSKIVDGNIRIYEFNVYEPINVNGVIELRENYIYSEQDLLSMNRPDLIDVYLNRDRIERKFKETGGYMGHYGQDGRIYENVRLRIRNDANSRIDPTVNRPFDSGSGVKR